MANRRVGRDGILRVSVQGVGYIGPVEISSTTTLTGLRQLIASTFDTDSFPQHYVFLVKGVAVGSKNEGGVLAASLRSGITLLPTDESPIAARVSVALWTGARFRMWALPSCTFNQLRGEASRFWHLNPADTLLCDAEDSLWPESALVHDSLPAGDTDPPQPGTDRHTSSSSTALRPGASPPNAPRVFREEDQPDFVLHLRDRYLEQQMSTLAFTSSPSDDDGNEVEDRMTDKNGNRQVRHRRLVQPQAQRAARAAASSNSLGLDSTFVDEFADDDDVETKATAAALPLQHMSDDEMEDEERDEKEAEAPDGHPTVGLAARAFSLPVRRDPPLFMDNDTPLMLAMRFVHHSLPVEAAALFAPFGSREDRLWRIFTWYGVMGDATDPFHLRGRQWRRLLGDCDLLQYNGSSSRDTGRSQPANGQAKLITPEQADVIFAAALADGRRSPARSRGHGSGVSAGLAMGGSAETASIPMAALALRDCAQAEGNGNQSSLSTTGLDYVSFLRALVMVALRVDKTPVLLHPNGMSTCTMPPHPTFPVDADTHANAVRAISVVLSCPVAQTGAGGHRQVASRAQTDGSSLSVANAQRQRDVQAQPRVVAERATAALLSLLQGSILPLAARWQASSWAREAHLVYADGSSIEEILAAEPALAWASANNDGGAKSAVASMAPQSVIGILRRFFPAFKLLFSYYADAPVSASGAVAGLERKRNEHDKAPSGGYSRLLSAKRQRADGVPVVLGFDGLPSDAATVGIGESDGEEEAELAVPATSRPQSPALKSVTTDSTVRTALSHAHELMERMRAAAASERAARYAIQEDAKVAMDGHDRVGEHREVHVATIARLALQSSGISPNSVAAGAKQRQRMSSNVQAGSKSKLTKSQQASYLGRAVAQQGAKATKLRIESSVIAAKPVALLSGDRALAVPKPGTDAGCRPRSRTGMSASMSFDAFCKFSAECGIAALGSLGKSPPIPTRIVTEAFLAAAACSPGAALLQATDVATQDSRVAVGLPDPTSDRTRLTFTQFISCLARLSVRLGQHALALTDGDVRVPGQGVLPAEHVLLSASAAAVPCSFRVKALLQGFETGLSQSSKLGALLTTRRDNLSAGSDKLLRGIQAFHAEYTSMMREEAQPDYGALLLAHAQQAVATGALVRAQTAMIAALAQQRHGGMMDDAGHDAKAAFLVEGKVTGIGMGSGGHDSVHALSATLILGPPHVSQGQAKADKGAKGSIRRVVHPPLFAADLVRFVGLSPTQAATLADSVAKDRSAKGKNMGGKDSAPNSPDAPAHTLAVQVTALADLDAVWHEQQAIRAGTARLLKVRQAEARSVSSSFAMSAAAADMLPGLGPPHPPHSLELSRRHAVWAQLKEARDMTAAAVQEAVNRQRAARHGVLAIAPEPVQVQVKPVTLYGIDGTAGRPVPSTVVLPPNLPARSSAPRGESPVTALDKLLHLEGRSAAPLADTAQAHPPPPHRVASTGSIASRRLADASIASLQAHARDRDALSREAYSGSVTAASYSSALGALGAPALRGSLSPSPTTPQEVPSIGLPMGGEREGAPLEKRLEQPMLLAVPLAQAYAGTGTFWPSATAIAAQSSAPGSLLVPVAAPHTTPSQGIGASTALSSPARPPPLEGGRAPVAHTAPLLFPLSAVVSAEASVHAKAGDGNVQSQIAGAGRGHASDRDEEKGTGWRGIGRADARGGDEAGFSTSATETEEESEGAIAGVQAPKPVEPLTIQPVDEVVKPRQGLPGSDGPVPVNTTSVAEGGGGPGASVGSGPIGRARSGAIDASARDRPPVKPAASPGTHANGATDGVAQSVNGAGRIGTRTREVSPDSTAQRAAEGGSGKLEGKTVPSSAPTSPSKPDRQVQAGAGKGTVPVTVLGPVSIPPTPFTDAAVLISADARTRAIVERRLYWKRILLDGAVFIKYGRSGYPHKRFVWLDTDCEAIRWRKPGSAAQPRDARTEVIVVAEITEVLEGTNTPVFARNIKSIGSADCCISVMTPARSLDLESTSAAQREEWGTALLALRKYKNLI